jgi:hypothetical protein
MAPIKGPVYFSLAGYVRTNGGFKHPVYHVENYGTVDRSVLKKLHDQRAFVGFKPLPLISFLFANVFSFTFAYFTLLTIIDHALDQRGSGNFFPGYCYKRVTDANLGMWPKLRHVLASANKNMHFAITSNGLWCHVHSYRIHNHPSVDSLRSEFRRSEDSKRWDIRVGAEYPFVEAKVVNVGDGRTQEYLEKTILMNDKILSELKTIRSTLNEIGETKRSLVKTNLYISMLLSFATISMNFNDGDGVFRLLVPVTVVVIAVLRKCS